MIKLRVKDNVTQVNRDLLKAVKGITHEQIVEWYDTITELKALEGLIPKGEKEIRRALWSLGFADVYNEYKNLSALIKQLKIFFQELLIDDFEEVYKETTAEDVKDLNRELIDAEYKRIENLKKENK
jgi:hypothetical protein